ncbi:MAG: hypothetical protein ABSC51_11775 [Gaiellaceae bacterium]|jgi:hypothetical protein
MSLITGKGIYWRAVAVLLLFTVTLTLGVVSPGALAIAKRDAANSVTYGSLRTAPAARALPKHVAAGSAAYVSSRGSSLESARTLKRSAASSVTYSDPAGDCTSTDAPTVPVGSCDIQNVTVSNDDSGLITFKVGIPGSPTLTEDMEIAVFIDSDQNPATGDSSGYDYMLDYWTNAGDPAKPIYVALSKLTSAGSTGVPAPASLNASYTSGVATITIGAADLGSIGALDFDAVAFSGLTYDSSGNPTNYDTAPFDVAPDTSSWSYTVSLSLSAARLQGKFRVTGRITSLRGLKGKVGKTFHETWRFVPQCSRGVCGVTVVIPDTPRIKLARSGATHYGTHRWTTRCNGSRDRILAKIKLHVTKGATINGEWRATNWQGTERYSTPKTKTCSSSLEVNSDRGILKQG